MSDIAVIGIEVANLKDKCEETYRTVGGLEDECSNLSDRIHAGEIWRNGNGAKGAEARLQTVEKEMSDIKTCVEKVASDEGIARIAREAARAVVSNARDKDRTLISKVKAFAPYFAAVCMLIATVMTVLLK
jgi:predicted NBD/HSP70 family sugar kinase